MGAPPNPVDGTKYAELLLGVPMVLEYDDSTGGFKLVIDVENTLEVTMTGITLDVGTLSSIANWQLPAQYPEDSVFVGGSTGTMVLAVRTDTMQTYVSDDGDFATLNVDGLGRLYTYTTGSHTFADTEMSAAVALGDALSNPTAGGVGAYGLGYDSAAGAWRRVRVDPETFALLVSVTGSVDTELPPAAGLTDTYANPTVPGVGAFGMAIDPVTGNWRRVRVDPETFGLLVSVTGTVTTSLEAGDIELGAVEVKDADTDNRQRVTADGRAWVNALITGTVATAATQLNQLLPGQYVEDEPHVSGATGTFPLSVRQDAPAALAGAGDYSPFITDSLGRLHTFVSGAYTNVLGQQYDPQGRLEVVASVSGTVALSAVDIEIGAVEIKNADSDLRAVVNVLADAQAQPTGTLAVGAHNLIYDIVGDNWDRDPARIQGNGMASSVVPQRTAFNMFRHYTNASWSMFHGGSPASDGIDGTENLGEFQRGINTRSAMYMHRGSSSFDRVVGNKERGLNVNLISGSFPDESTVTLADAMANPANALVAGAHLMGYNGSTWDRVYMGLSGSLAVDLITQLDAVNDEVTAYVTGTLTVDTELPAAVVLSDGMATPTPPAVGGFGMGYDPVADDWNRIRLDAVTGAQLVGITGTVSVATESDLPLVVTEDEVTAYITGTTALNLMGKTIVRAVIDVSGSAAGEETLVAAVGGQKIKVLETMLIGNADVSIFFQSGYTGTALTGPLSLPADGDGFFVGTPAQIEAHHFETIAGEALVLDISANVLLGGWINYITEA